MPEEEGLPLPPLPQRPRPTPPRAEGVPENFIREQLGGRLDRIRSKPERWRKLTTNVPAPERFGSGNTLERLRSRAELLADAVDKGDILEAGEQFLRIATGPISAGVDLYQASKINALLDQFMKNHGGPLQSLKSYMSRVGNLLGGLTALLDNAKYFDTRDARDILNKKRTKGDATLARIEDRLKDAKTPEEREKLQAMKDDLTKWMADRDQRVKREEAEINELDIRTSVLNGEVNRQRHRLAEAGQNASDIALKDLTVHATPEAAIFAAGLGSYLINARLNIFDTLEP